MTPSTPDLPRAALVASWLGACLRAEAAADDLAGVIDRRHHVLTGLPQSQGPVPLLEAVGRLRALGTTEVSCALPAPADPLGLGGPPAFNRAALEAGSAVLLGGARLGLVPVTVGGAVEWRCAAADAPPWVDLPEAAAMLRSTLLEVTSRLVDLEVATWQPEIPDALMNPRQQPAPLLPPSYDDRRAQTVDRALLCLRIVRLAGEVEPGALTSLGIDDRRAALADLDRAARRALVAACR